MAKLWQRPVLGGDNDAQAVEVAIENAERNGVAPLCRFVTSIGLRAPELSARAPYDLIVANILAGPLMELSESFGPATRPGGRVLLSGLLVEQADMILVDLQAPRLRLRALASTARPAAPTGAPCCCARRRPQTKRAGDWPALSYSTLTLRY